MTSGARAGIPRDRQGGIRASQRFGSGRSLVWLSRLTDHAHHELQCYLERVHQKSESHPARVDVSVLLKGGRLGAGTLQLWIDHRSDKCGVFEHIQEFLHDLDWRENQGSRSGEGNSQKTDFCPLIQAIMPSLFFVSKEGICPTQTDEQSFRNVELARRQGRWSVKIKTKSGEGQARVTDVHTNIVTAYYSWLAMKILSGPQNS